MSQEPVRYWVPRSVLVGVDSLLRNQTDEIVVLASDYDALVRELEEAKVEDSHWRAAALAEQLATLTAENAKLASEIMGLR